MVAYAWKSWLFSRKILRQERFDLLHAFFSVPSGFVALLLRLEFGVPFLVSLRGSDVPGYSERFKNMYPLLRPVTRSIWRHAARVIANSEGLRTLALLTDASRDIAIIRNGVDTEEFFPVPREYTARPEVPFRILAIARLTPRKGLRTLLEAMLILQNRKQRVFTLDIAGDGDERLMLETFVREKGLSDRVRFLGRVPHRDIVPLYHRAHVYVLPSLSEGMSNNVLEAIASGLPIITTDTGGTRELVEEGRNGCVIRMNDPEHIVEKIVFLAEHPEQARLYGMESRRRALELGWVEVAKSYRKAYQDITKSS
ncbi:MAG: glycosyltransferase [Candidatus Moraniibacteriota bacterium]|nr:MAG: glycosyltransferase [Candidatus Moranbacteria bacterium]